jgi:hypothetical protein
MKAIRMLHFLRQEDVKSICGLFGVPKDDDSIRLIIDARPTNCKFKKTPKVCLPTPDLLTRLRVESDVRLFAAKIDIDNFYHRMLLPEWMQPYFALPAVRACDVGLESEFGDTWIHPCCTTLPMGWAHSVLLAQAAHEFFIDNFTTKLRTATRLTRTDDYNLSELDRMCYTCYIDDLTLFGADVHDMDAAIDDYIDAATKMRLKVKMSKLVRPAELVESCGLEVDGVEHTVGVSPRKLWCLCKETRVLLHTGRCTGEELRRFVGKWSWVILARRPAFSVFNAVYRFSAVARNRVFSLWPSVCKELSVICDLAPLLFTRLDADWFPKVVATDASTSGFGVVASHADVQFQVDFAKRLSSHGCSEMEKEEEEKIEHLPWTDIISSPWQNTDEHINVLELRAVISAVRWILSHPSSLCSRVLMFCDSQVVIPIVLRGRSSSFRLLCRRRFLSALELASGLQIFMRYVRSAVNPADEPSRRFQ